MKAFLFTDNLIILVLSPKIDPPVVLEDGSTARTETFKPKFINFIPKDSIKVDFPTPGTPVIPILIVLLLAFILDNK